MSPEEQVIMKHALVFKTIKLINCGRMVTRWENFGPRHSYKSEESESLPFVLEFLLTEKKVFGGKVQEKHSFRIGVNECDKIDVRNYPQIFAEIEKNVELSPLVF